MTLRVPTVRLRGEPERKPDGTLDGVRGVKADSPDEILALFARMLAPHLESAGTTAEERAAQVEEARFNAEFQGLIERGAKGDAGAFKLAIQRGIEQARAVDPLFPNGVGTPGDFLEEFPVPLDTTEIITMCDETTLWRNLPEVVDDRNVVSWRELNELDFVTGTDSSAFAKGDCPETFEHDGESKTQALKHIGAERSLSESDILASRFSIARGYGMRELVGGFGPGENGQTPGEGNVSSFMRGNIADMKSKAMTLASVLVMNDWDRMLVNGNDSTNPQEFDGIVQQVTAGNGARTNGGTTTGTFSQTHFDQFLAAGCAYPDALVGHPSALLAISNAYFQAGTQTIFYDSNQRISPGFNFAPEIVTAFGVLKLIADRRFPITDNNDGTITSKVYPLLMRHNGENLVYKQTQIPLSFKDIIPGCTAIKFIIWAVTALVVKAMCAQSVYTARFAGLADADACQLISPNAT